jgi:hypothetical protein
MFGRGSRHPPPLCAIGGCWAAHDRYTPPSPLSLPPLTWDPTPPHPFSPHPRLCTNRGSLSNGYEDVWTSPALPFPAPPPPSCTCQWSAGVGGGGGARTRKQGGEVCREVVHTCEREGGHAHDRAGAHANGEGKGVVTHPLSHSHACIFLSVRVSAHPLPVCMHAPSPFVCAPPLLSTCAPSCAPPLTNGPRKRCHARRAGHGGAPPACRPVPAQPRLCANVLREGGRTL